MVMRDSLVTLPGGEDAPGAREIHSYEYLSAADGEAKVTG
jgi:hypothetical protein